MALPRRRAVIGASGRIGRAVADEARLRGHAVTGVARDAWPLRATGGVVVAADVLDAVAVERAVAGHDAVVAAVKARPGDTEGLVPAAVRVLLEALPRAGVRRLVFVGGGGSLERSPGQRFVDAPDFPEQYRADALAQAEALGILRASDGTLEWSYASPPPAHLVDGARTGVYRAEATDRPIVDEHGESRITVPDFAAAVVDALERGSFPRKRFTAAY